MTELEGERALIIRGASRSNRDDDEMFDDEMFDEDLNLLGGLAGETSFEMLAEEIGSEPAKLFCGQYGGRRIYLMGRLPRHHPFIALMGPLAARLLIARFGPGWINVPLGPNATALLRRRRIKQMSEAGYSVPAIAEALGVHERTVERHRAALRAETNSPSSY